MYRAHERIARAGRVHGLHGKGRQRTGAHGVTVIRALFAQRYQHQRRPHIEQGFRAAFQIGFAGDKLHFFFGNFEQVGQFDTRLHLPNGFRCRFPQ